MSYSVKNLVLAAASLFSLATVSTLSSTSLASGFICEGQGYHVKLYNQVQPSRGTKNPAILVISAESSGLVARVQGDELVKTVSEKAVTFSGTSHDPFNGRFASVRLSIAKAVSQSSGYEGAHFARLTLKSDKDTQRANLACADYLKGRK